MNFFEIHYFSNVFEKKNFFFPPKADFWLYIVFPSRSVVTRIRDTSFFPCTFHEEHICQNLSNSSKTKAINKRGAAAKELKARSLNIIKL